MIAYNVLLRFLSFYRWSKMLFLQLYSTWSLSLLNLFKIIFGLFQLLYKHIMIHSWRFLYPYVISLLNNQIFLGLSSLTIKWSTQFLFYILRSLLLKEGFLYKLNPAIYIPFTYFFQFVEMFLYVFINPIL